MTATKKLIGFIANIDGLHLEDVRTRALLGGCRWMNAPSGGFIFVCQPKDWTAARNFLVGVGATVLPALHDPASQVGADVATKLPGVIAASDISWVAAQKLHAHFGGWPPLDPNE